MTRHEIHINNFFRTRAGNPLDFIAGPCVIESMAHALVMAEGLSQVCEKYGARLIYKSSFEV